jgi:ABC-type branched-subunit amino acid transport system ATPase component
MENNGDLVVRTEHLTKHFGKLVAVDDLSLEVRKGEIFAF